MSGDRLRRVIEQGQRDSMKPDSEATITGQPLVVKILCLSANKTEIVETVAVAVATRFKVNGNWCTETTESLRDITVEAQLMGATVNSGAVIATHNLSKVHVAHGTCYTLCNPDITAEGWSLPLDELNEFLNATECTPVYHESFKPYRGVGTHATQISV